MRSHSDTGPLGPVGFYTLLVLLGVSPLVRGGNRSLALIVLECLGIALLLALYLRTLNLGTAIWPADSRKRTALLLALATAPVWLALVYLTPLPEGLLGGDQRAAYAPLLQSVQIDAGGWRPLSLVPDATAASLLAGLPLVAALLAGYASSARQLRAALAVVVVLAFLQLAFGIAQAAGGMRSALNFGMVSPRPTGTFANPNHFGNYLAMAIVGYTLLAIHHLSRIREDALHSRLSPRVASLMWTSGATVLVAGILLTRSRGALLAFAVAGLVALIIVFVLSSRTRRWRTLLAVAGAGAVIALAMVGAEFALSRFESTDLEQSGEARGDMAATSLQGAMALWPWGAGWGTFPDVYPLFQPEHITGFVNQAHHDYVQILFDAGIFGVLLMGLAAALAVQRVLELRRAWHRHGRLGRDETMAALCGAGLLALLLHSWVEFNMHIPANAILASLLAGAFLRPLKR